jgi:predicted deacylase
VRPSGTSRLTRIPGPAGYVLAPTAGVFEAFHELGDAVEAGAPAGQVHVLDDPGRAPQLALFKASGTLYARRAFGRVERGNCVSVVVTDYAPG